MNGSNEALRNLIGQALHDAIHSGAPEPDWYDAREIDRLVDAVMGVIPSLDVPVEDFYAQTLIVQAGPVMVHGKSDAVGQVIKMLRDGGMGYITVECEHVWVCGDNEYVSNCTMCRKCHAIKPTNQM